MSRYNYRVIYQLSEERENLLNITDIPFHISLNNRKINVVKS